MPVRTATRVKTMKVYNLRCDQNHEFEGWFSSADQFDEQQASGLTRCPLCDSAQVTRLPSAARLQIGRASELPQLTTGPAVWLEQLRSMLGSIEDVGGRFAEEARRIHFGEAPQRAIRGQASENERRELEQEGIDVVPLPSVLGSKQSLQ